MKTAPTIDRLRLAIAILAGIIFSLTTAFDTALSAAEPDSSVPLTQAVRRLTVSKNDLEKSRDLAPRIRKTTWQLLVGELAADSAFSLSSGSYDELLQGLKDLDQLILDLKESPELEREMSQQLQLAMRFDATRVRRPEIEKQRQLSRQNELDRLSQLREINRTYRDLIGFLVRTQTSLLTGQSNQVASFGQNSAQLFTQAEEIVRRRHDYYLFQDEPALSAESDDELKLVREVARPISRSVRHHQMALQAYTLVQLAQSSDEHSREKLESARQLAETSIADTDDPPKLGHWALALASREIGRLETTPDPWNEAAHQRAQPWFEQSRKHLDLAQKGIPADTDDSAWVSQIKQQLAELAGHESTIQLAMTKLKVGASVEAVSHLERCAMLHRVPQVAVALADCRRLSGDRLDELDAFVERLWSAGLFSDNDAQSRLIRGRQAVLGIWHSLIKEPLRDQAADARRNVISRLEQALADLEIASTSATKFTRQMAEVYLSLGSVIQLSMSPESNVDVAKQRMLSIPQVIAELQLERHNETASIQFNATEAVVAGQLAYGHLALRFLSDYHDVAQTAFACATDVRAEVPAGLTMPQPLGSVILHTVLSRSDRADSRLAREEKSVRRALQQAFPALASLNFAPGPSAANNLQAAARGLERQSENEIAHVEIDPRDAADARTSASKEIRNATILAYLAAHAPAEALCEALFSVEPNIQTTNLGSLDLNAIRRSLSKETDPVRQSITALALEEYAASNLITTDRSRRDMFQLALDLQRLAKKQFDDSNLLKQSRPAELEMNGQAIQRLTEPAYFLTRSQGLMTEFRLSEARQQLDSGIRRHADSVQLREAYVQTLIDEADLRPEQSRELITKAIEQLELLTSNSTEPAFSSFLKLAELYERTAKDERALSIYRRVVDQSRNDRQRLQARARVTALQIRTPKN